MAAACTTADAEPGMWADCVWASCPASSPTSRSPFVSESIVKELVSAGVHFGHRASLWNPKMAPYIYARKNQIHIIDIRETLRGLLRAQKYLPAGRRGRQPGAVCRHQAAGGGSGGARVAAVRHAVRRRTLAGRRADELPHDSQPVGTPGRTGSVAYQRSDHRILQEDAIGAGSRVSQDVPQPERSADR